MIRKNTNDTVCFIAISQFVWGRRGLDIVRQYFDKVWVLDLPFPMDDACKKKAREFLKNHSYDYLISFWNGLFLLEQEIKAARKGAINFHPAPPEHPGMGMFSFVRVFPEKRSFHGATLHEIDSKLDHGHIYLADRFPVLPRVYMTDVELVLQTGNLTLKHLDAACSVLSHGAPTSSLSQLSQQEEHWSNYRSSHDEEEWLKNLDSRDPTRDLNVENGIILYRVLGAAQDSMIS